MEDDFLVFGAPLIGEQEIDEVIASLRSGWLGTGPKVARFEADFAAYQGVSEQYVAALSSCTAALHISMVASGIGPGDEVITTPLTFAATVNAIIHAGATPVLADVDRASMNIDPAAVAAAVTSRTRAIMPVHFAGRSCEMDVLSDVAHNHDLMIIEDCAHAIETEYRGRKAGTWGDFGSFSFYATKNVTTGEGGMLVARRDEHIARARVLALHGLSQDAWHRFSDHGHKHYFVVECGFKYNMTDIQAALGIHQLRRVEENWRLRERIWQRYQEAFADLPVARPAPTAPDTRHAHHLYTLLIEDDAPITRDAMLEALTARNIGVGVHYLSIPEHPYYQQRFGWRPEQVPNAMRIGRQTISLPLSPKLTESDIDRVIAAVRGVLGATG